MRRSFLEDVTLLRERVLASGLSFLVEFETLLRLLRHTHTQLQQFAALPPFAAVVSRVFGCDASSAGRNVLNDWLRRETRRTLSEGRFVQRSDVRVGVVCERSASWCLRATRRSPALRDYSCTAGRSCATRCSSGICWTS